MACHFDSHKPYDWGKSLCTTYYGCFNFWLTSMTGRIFSRGHRYNERPRDSDGNHSRDGDYNGNEF